MGMSSPSMCLYPMQAGRRWARCDERERGVKSPVGGIKHGKQVEFLTHYLLSSRAGSFQVFTSDFGLVNAWAWRHLFDE